MLSLFKNSKIVFHDNSLFSIAAPSEIFHSVYPSVLPRVVSTVLAGGNQTSRFFHTRQSYLPAQFCSTASQPARKPANQPRTQICRTKSSLIQPSWVRNVFAIFIAPTHRPGCKASLIAICQISRIETQNRIV